jgi:hypothetical protein
MVPLHSWYQANTIKVVTVKKRGKKEEAKKKKDSNYFVANFKTPLPTQHKPQTCRPAKREKREIGLDRLQLVETKRLKESCYHLKGNMPLKKHLVQFVG